MPALANVRLAVDGVTGIGAAPGTIGSPSAALTSGRSWLVFARGNCRGTGAGSGGSFATLDLEIGGVPWARKDAAPSFGSPSFGAADSAQLAAVFLVADGDGDAMTFEASEESADGSATSCRALAIDVTDIPDEAGRWHYQTANTDSIVDTPPDGSGWVAMVSDRGGTPVPVELAVTPTRSGPALAIWSLEVAPGPTATEADQQSVRATVDGVAVDGSELGCGSGVSGVNRIASKGYVFVAEVDLVDGVEIVLALELNGSDGNGLVGYRRARLHLLEAEAFEGADLQVDEGSGATAATGATVDVSGLGVTVVPASSADYLLLAVGQGQFAAWPRAHIRTGGATNLLPDGAADAAAGTGTGGADDMTLAFLCEVATIASSTTVGMRVEAGAGVTSTWGEDCARAGSGPIRVAALRLVSADSEGSFESDSTEATELEATVRYEGELESDSTEATELEGTATNRAWLSSDAPAQLLFRLGGGGAGVPWTGDEVTPMASMLESLQGIGATRRPVGTPLTIAADANTAITPAVAERGQLLIGGAITPEGAGEATFRDGAAGDVLATQALADGVPFPLALLVLWSSAGNAVYVQCDVPLTGRAVASEI